MPTTLALAVTAFAAVTAIHYAPEFFGMSLAFFIASLLVYVGEA